MLSGRVRGLCKFGACVTLTCVHPDIDHLTRILFLCGRPDQETIDKIISEEVSETTNIIIYKILIV